MICTSLLASISLTSSFSRISFSSSSSSCSLAKAWPYRSLETVLQLRLSCYHFACCLFIYYARYCYRCSISSYFLLNCAVSCQICFYNQDYFCSLALFLPWLSSVSQATFASSFSLSYSSPSTFLLYTLAKISPILTTTSSIFFSFLLSSAPTVSRTSPITSLYCHATNSSTVHSSAPLGPSLDRISRMTCLSLQYSRSNSSEGARSSRRQGISQSPSWAKALRCCCQWAVSLSPRERRKFILRLKTMRLLSSSSVLPDTSDAFSKNQLTSLFSLLVTARSRVCRSFSSSFRSSFLIRSIFFRSSLSLRTKLVNSLNTILTFYLNLQLSSLKLMQESTSSCRMPSNWGCPSLSSPSYSSILLSTYLAAMRSFRSMAAVRSPCSALSLPSLAQRMALISAFHSFWVNSLSRSSFSLKQPDHSLRVSLNPFMLCLAAPNNCSNCPSSSPTWSSLLRLRSKKLEFSLRLRSSKEAPDFLSSSRSLRLYASSELRRAVSWATLRLRAWVAFFWLLHLSAMFSIIMQQFSSSLYSRDSFWQAFPIDCTRSFMPLHGSLLTSATPAGQTKGSSSSDFQIGMAFSRRESIQYPRDLASCLSPSFSSSFRLNTNTAGCFSPSIPSNPRAQVRSWPSFSNISPTGLSSRTSRPHLVTTTWSLVSTTQFFWMRSMRRWEGATGSSWT